MTATFLKDNRGITSIEAIIGSLIITTMFVGFIMALGVKYRISIQTLNTNQELNYASNLIKSLSLNKDNFMTATSFEELLIQIYGDDALDIFNTTFIDYDLILLNSNNLQNLNIGKIISTRDVSTADISQWLDNYNFEIVATSQVLDNYKLLLVNATTKNSNSGGTLYVTLF